MNNSILTESEAEELIEKLSSKSSIDEEDTLEVNNTSTKNKRSIAKSSTRSGDTTAYGTLTWNDGRIGDIAIHPLRRIKVELRDSDLIGSQLLGTTFTENDGSYSISFTNDSSVFENGGCDLFLRIFAGDDNADVVKSDGTTKYYVDTPYTDHQNVATGISEMIDHTVNMSNDNGKAIQISQALMTAQDFAWDMIGGENMPASVKAVFPATGEEITCYNNNKIYVCDFVNDHDYADWDVIMHEYGHHIAHYMEIENSPGLNHSYTENLADRYVKDSGLRLAWGEAWPTVFGALAQEYYADELTGVLYVADDGYTDISEMTVSYDYETMSIQKGEACEGSIIGILWDLFDNASEENDTISLGYQAWWDVTTGSHATTFPDFIQYFYRQYPDYVLPLGANLSYYKMASSGVTSPTSGSTLTTVPPSFSWGAQGGSLEYRNNLFTILFYRDNFDEAYYSINIGATTTSFISYTLTAHEWEQVLFVPGETIYVVIQSFQTSTPATGPYLSKVAEFSRPLYKISNISTTEVRIDGFYWGLDGAVTIPSEIEGKTVVGIADNAFRYKTFSSVTLPSTIRTIGSQAFRGCGNLTKADMGSTQVTRIEEMTFYYCTQLETIYLPNSIEYIGANAFGYTSKKSFVLPTTIATIGNQAFIGCTSTTIYTEYASRPTGWNSAWNASNRPVVWGCTLSSDSKYVVSFNKTSSNPSNATAQNGMNNPTRSGYTFGGWYTTSDYSGTKYDDIASAPNGTLYAKWTSSSCIAAGSLITLADGSQVAVENLTGNENLLVWNMLTGQYDTAPILFIDSDPLSSYEIIKLTFSDNTEVKVIDEHAFFDMTIGEYVFMRNDASQYIGHYFNKQGINGTYTTVQLINVTVYNETTTAWSPVTYGHLCYYVNGMLSMPGGTEGLINIFDVDTSLMQYDEEQMEEDILTYGLYTYEEFNAIIPLPEYVFDAFNGQYLKVSIGKGLITLDEIAALLERYAAFFE
ncbi:MAG: leucine-rich repeat protein [Clostridia bacterium]|nr:leucine-rich repeat protein [Clostridia bacterium]